MESKNIGISKWVRCIYSEIRPSGRQNEEFQPYLFDENGDAYLHGMVEYGHIWNRVQAMSPEYRKLFWKLYDQLPTHFGITLRRVMELKGISSSTLYYLIKEYGSDTMHPSTMQALMKCVYPERNIEMIPYISRALLVEQAVLMSGYGKSWGTWAYQIDPDFIRRTWEKKKNLPHAKKEIRDDITRIIQSDEAMYEYLDRVRQFKDSSYSDLYKEEMLNLFEDRKERFIMLRERGSLYSILSVLEEMSLLAT